MKKVLSIFCIFTIMMLQVSCGNNSSSEGQTQSQVVEDTSNNVISEEIPQEDEIVTDDNEQTIEEDTSIEDENIKLGEIVDSGECGENATWQLDEYGTLVISGTGELYDFSSKIDPETYQAYWEHSCPWNDYNDYIKSIVIEEGITAIYGGSFYMKNLINVKLPNTLKKIKGDNQYFVFDTCVNLININIPNNLTTLEYAFYKCGLVNMSLPNSLTKIENNAFLSCPNLENIDIPNSVITIGYSAFQDCSSLKSINIPNSVTSIGENAFAYCSSLISIEIPNGVTSIEYGTFANCINLKYINIPDSVTLIKNRAFAGCSSLESVQIPNSVTEIRNDSFRKGFSDTESAELLDVTIQGTINSYAQQYAEEHNFNFEVMSNPN